ncbi:hypothetical protein AAMO2058_000956300 [Amorphochlora amoebiformis]
MKRMTAKCGKSYFLSVGLSFGLAMVVLIASSIFLRSPGPSYTIQQRTFRQPLREPVFAQRSRTRVRILAGTRDGNDVGRAGDGKKGGGKDAKGVNRLVESPDMNKLVDSLADMSGLTRTENMAVSWRSTKSACLDFFFDTLPDVHEDEVFDMLERAWNEDPQITLKLIFQLGDVRKGKGDRTNYYRSLMWLFRNYPKTFLKNAHYIPRHTCLKCLLNMLMYILHEDSNLMSNDLNKFPNRGTVTSSKRFSSRDMQEKSKLKKMRKEALKEEFILEMIRENHYEKRSDLIVPRIPKNKMAYIRCPWLPTEEWANEQVKLLYASWANLKNRVFTEDLQENQKRHMNAMKKESADALDKSEAARAYFDMVADLFANALKESLDEYEKRKTTDSIDEEVSSNALKSNMRNWTLLDSGLFAKWAPSPEGMHDKMTPIVDAIVERLFPQELYRIPNPEGTYEDYLKRMRYRYKTKVLSPLRRYAEVPEHFIGSGSWNLTNYRRMASRCCLLYGSKVFAKHDPERYNAYLQEAKQGKVKLASNALKPHELIKSVIHGHKDDPQVITANLQWTSLAENVRKSGGLSNAMAVCDVSGSMYGTPMDVAVALSLIISEITVEPWKGLICSFSKEPKIEKIASPNGLNLKARADQVVDMNWGMNTDFERVFDIILEIALRGNVDQDQMVKQLFVFSDMEFDQAKSSDLVPWETTHEHVRVKFENAGYEMPEIIYWNLRRGYCGSKPVSGSERGVAMLSGFNTGMLKSFLENRLEDMQPFSQMMKILDSKHYAHLEVADEDL